MSRPHTDQKETSQARLGELYRDGQGGIDSQNEGDRRTAETIKPPRSPTKFRDSG